MIASGFSVGGSCFQKFFNKTPKFTLYGLPRPSDFFAYEVPPFVARQSFINDKVGFYHVALTLG